MRVQLADSNQPHALSAAICFGGLGCRYILVVFDGAPGRDSVRLRLDIALLRSPRGERSGERRVSAPSQQVHFANVSLFLRAGGCAAIDLHPMSVV
jgi:hypothetical protein